jgi:cobalt/nickel transport protein
MRMSRRPLLPLLVLGALLPTAASGHLPVLFPDKALAKKGKLLTLQYGVGHPFERELVAGQKPASLFVQLPEGRGSIDLSAGLAATKAGETKSVSFTPRERGDYIASLICPLTQTGNAMYRDTTKVVINVGGVQRGWDELVGHPVEIAPLTRPYGLTKGCGFRGVVLLNGKPYANAGVRFEHRSVTPPAKQGRPDAVFVTRVEKTNDRGEFSITLPEDGWWVLFALAPGKSTVKNGKPIRTYHRGNFWVKVGR